MFSIFYFFFFFIFLLKKKKAKHYVHILEIILRLRQIATHLSLCTNKDLTSLNSNINYTNKYNKFFN